MKNLPNYLKVLAFVLGLISINQTGYAQDKQGLYIPNDPDSLKTLLEEAFANRDLQTASVYGQATVNYAEKEYGRLDTNYASATNNLGMIYKYMGRLQEAEQKYNTALKALDEADLKDHLLYWTVYQNLAILLEEKGDYATALQMYFEARESFNRISGKNTMEYFRINNNIGDLYRSMRAYSEAQRYLEEAIQIAKPLLGAEHPHFGVLLNNLANVYNGLKNYEQALNLQLQVLANTERNYGPDHVEHAISLNNLAITFTNMHEFDTARVYAARAIAIVTKVLGTKHPLYGNWLNNLGGINLEAGKPAEAIPYYKEALAVISDVYGSNHSTTNKIIYNIVEGYQSMNMPDSAWHFIELGLELTRNLVDQQFAMVTELEKQALLTEISSDLDATNKFAMLNYKTHPEAITNAYNNELLIKGLVLSSTRSMQQTILEEADNEALAVYNQWTDLKAYLNDQYALPKMRRAPTLDSLETEINTLERSLLKYSQAFTSSQNISNTTWQQVRNALPANSAAIEFIRVDCSHKPYPDSFAYAALVLLPDADAPTFVPLFDENTLAAALGNTKANNSGIDKLYASRGAAGSGGQQSTTSQDLYTLIWHPLKKALGDVEQVFVSPVGLLHQVALHALPQPTGKPLATDVAIQYVGSTRMLLHKTKPQNDKSYQFYGGISYNLSDEQWLKQVQPKPVTADEGADLLALADIENRTATRSRGSAWNALPGTLTEVQSISQLLDKNGWTGQTYSGAAAVEETFKTNSGNMAPTLLHVATHGFFLEKGNQQLHAAQVTQSADPMLRSGLILAGGNRDWQNEALPAGIDNGILTAREVSLLDLRKTELVVLSACETALGDINGSEGVFGLQRAFKQAGADYLIISLWKVPDAQTVELMELFYKYWQKGQPIPEAFRKAQLKMSKKYSPYEWAAFKLVR